MVVTSRDYGRSEGERLEPANRQIGMEGEGILGTCTNKQLAMQKYIVCTTAQILDIVCIFHSSFEREGEYLYVGGWAETPLQGLLRSLLQKKLLETA